MNTFTEIQQLDESLRNLWGNYQNIEQENVIDKDQLEKLGYFRHFSHHLCAPAGLTSEAIEHALKTGKFQGKLLEAGHTFFTPAACLNLYDQLFEMDPAEGLVTVTSLAEVFRFESQYNAYRKLNFWVREFLFYGKREDIAAEVDRICTRLLSRLSPLKGEITVQTATDSFVPSRFENLMSASQQETKSKSEFISSEAQIAFGSINYHGRHFIRNYALKAEGLETACIGIGLTRLNELVKDGIVEII